MKSSRVALPYLRLTFYSRRGFAPRWDSFPCPKWGSAWSTVASRATVFGYNLQDGVRQKFTEKERDNESGLDYFGARYYSSAQGRFTSVDLIMIHADRMLEPQRLNLYMYSRNNPLRFIDPDGLDDYEYDQSGMETKHVKRGFWHNFWHGDTYKLNADNGQTYNVEGPLKQLSNGQRYNLVDERQTSRLMNEFELTHE